MAGLQAAHHLAKMEWRMICWRPQSAEDFDGSPRKAEKAEGEPEKLFGLVILR
jgi:hypothetical protein